MSHSHASKLLLLLTSSLICLGCDEETQPPTQAPTRVAQKASSSDDVSQPRARTAAAASAAEEAAAPAERTPAEPVQPSREASVPEPAPKKRARGAGINQVLRDKEVQAPLTLETRLEAHQGQWVARWKLTNRGEEPIYVVTQLPVVKGGKARPDQHRIYLRPQGETLHLTKRMWRVPRGVSPLRIELPYLLRLEPGQTHQGAIRLPASVAASYPYRTSPERARVLVNQVAISFGYFTQEAGPQLSEGGLYTLPYAALSKQAFVTSAPHAARLAVR